MQRAYDSTPPSPEAVALAKQLVAVLLREPITYKLAESALYAADKMLTETARLSVDEILHGVD